MRRTPSFRSFRISFVVVLIPLSFSQRCALAWTALSRVGHGILSSQYYSNGSLEHLFASRGPRPIASIDEVCSPTFKPRTCRVILPSLARVIVQSLCNTEGSPSSAAAFAALQWHLSLLLRNIYCRLITFRRSHSATRHEFSTYSFAHTIRLKSHHLASGPERWSLFVCQIAGGLR
jgi:hypothetical protein